MPAQNKTRTMNTRHSSVKLASELQVGDIVDIHSLGCYYGSQLRFFKIKMISRGVSHPDECIFIIQRLLADGTEDESYLSRSTRAHENCKVRLPRREAVQRE